ncbi:hypothetical protein PYW08_016032 [Mythimna loreyi]|uniref:Uncharacterized protein n=1 Tax=Mythimna loreyi TaxID=667449 RepID=A0ACC2QXI9_9NEOP|nr:hypothetical protein PYW08_016032 [Mythimna loreyi]
MLLLFCVYELKGKPYEIVNLNGKTVLLYQNYTFSKQGPSFRYQACSKKMKNCKARLTLNVDGSIKSAVTEHNHPPPRILQTGKPYEMIFLNGRTVLLYQKHTFSKRGPPFRLHFCSKKVTNNCKAKVVLDENGDIEYASIDHNHPPPNLIRSSRSDLLFSFPESTCKDIDRNSIYLLEVGSFSNESQTDENQQGNRLDDEHVLNVGANQMPTTTTLPLNVCRQRKANARKSYKSRVIVPKKTIKIKPMSNCCKLKCHENVNEETRMAIFNQYYGKDMTWQLQKQFIVSRVTEKPVARRYGNGKEQRMFTRDYTFLVNDIPVKVCKPFFLNTLAISGKVVHRSLTMVRKGMSLDDRRGRHPSANKTPEETKDTVRKHLAKMSQQCLQQKSQISSSPEITKLYSKYLSFCEKECIPKNIVAKYWLYRRIMKTEYDSLFKPLTNP